MDWLTLQRHKMEYDRLPVSKGELYRYLGYGRETPDEQTAALVQDCLAELLPQAAPQGAFMAFPVQREGARLDLGFVAVESRDLARNLEGCTGVILFAATLGVEADRLTQRYAARRPARGLVMQAAGAMLIEAYCDELNAAITGKLRQEGLGTKPRFSPGYGDFPLACQEDVFRVLNCPKVMGLTLTAALLMAPTKSVTGVIGFGPFGAETAVCSPKEGCPTCGKTNCAFRRR